MKAESAMKMAIALRSLRDCSVIESSCLLMSHHWSMSLLHRNQLDRDLGRGRGEREREGEGERERERGREGGREGK